MQSGYLLRNRYRIENRLSAGGFGETYIAIDEDYPSQRRVVVKHLKPQSNDPAALEMARRLFDNEALTLANLGEKTDRIPTLYAYFEEHREFYLVQELIEGQTLTQELGTRKLSEAETIAVVREILAVLTEVHTKKIVHRDLKPDNIIRRSSDRQLVLIDFGAVKAVRQTTLNVSNATQSIGIGTTGYMPTEQAMGYPTSASDIYAVGAIALQCLTGQSPSKLFDEDALELRWQHLCSVSDRVVNILTKMVASRHLDRYPNAMEAIKEIDPLIAPSASIQSIPTIRSQPNPQPPTQPDRPAPPNPSPAIIKAPVQAPQAPVSRQNKLIKWTMLGYFGLVGLFVLLKSLDPSKPPSVAPIATTQTPVDNYATLANQKYERKDYQGALADYNQAIKLNPDDADAYNNRGLIKHENLPDYQGALADYNQAIKLKSNDATFYNNRGLLNHEKLQDYRGALADYDQAIKLNPNDADTYNNRGLLKHERLQDDRGALADYNQAIKLKPNYALAYANRGSLKDRKLHDDRGGLADYDRSIKIDPNNAITYNNRGLLKHEKLQDYQGAIADYSQSIKINPNYALAYSNRGLLKREKLQDYQGALTDYDRAIKIDPNDATIYNNRGLLKHEKLQDYQGALADYNQSIKLDSSYALAYNNRGLLKHEKLPDYQAALADYNQAIKLDSNNATAHNNRGLLKYNKMNDRSGGITDMKKAAKLYQQQGSQQDYRETISQLKEWGEK